MITKLKLAQRVLRTISGGRTLDESRVAVQDAMMAVDNARDFVVYRLIMDNYSRGERDIPYDLLKDYYAEVVDKGGMLLAEADFRVLSGLPNDIGLYQVLNKEESVIFTPLLKGQSAFMSGMEFGHFGGDTVYEPFIGGVKFFDPAMKGCEVVIRVIVASQYIDEDEPNYTPAELENIIFEQAIKAVATQKQVPVDHNNDNKEM